MGLWLGLGLCFIARPAFSAPAECAPGSPWIAVDFREMDQSTRFRSLILAHLNTGLGEHGLCAREREAPGTEAPIASISVASRAGDNVRVSVDVRDEVTEKRVGRDIDLTDYTDEGRAYAIALTAEELMRASWAELALREKRTKRSEAPREVTAVVRDAVEPETSAQTRLSGALGAEWFSGGQHQLGFDVVFDYRGKRGFGIWLALGPRWAARSAGQFGSVGGRVVAGELAGTYQLIVRPRFDCSLQAGLRGGQIAFDGTPDGTENRQGAEATGPFLSIRAGAVGAFRPLPAFELSLRAGLGTPLLAAGATEDGTVVTSLSGLELYGALGIGVVL